MFVRKGHSSFFTLSLSSAFFRPPKDLEGPASLCSFVLKTQVMISHGTSLSPESSYESGRCLLEDEIEALSDADW